MFFMQLLHYHLLFNSYNNLYFSSGLSDDDLIVSQSLESYNRKISAGNKIKDDVSMVNNPFGELMKSMKVAPVCLGILGGLNLLATKR